MVQCYDNDDDDDDDDNDILPHMMNRSRPNMPLSKINKFYFFTSEHGHVC